jgi:hypothetical protein
VAVAELLVHGPASETRLVAAVGDPTDADVCVTVGADARAAATSLWDSLS